MTGTHLFWSRVKSRFASIKVLLFPDWIFVEFILIFINLPSSFVFFWFCNFCMKYYSEGSKNVYILPNDKCDWFFLLQTSFFCCHLKWRFPLGQHKTHECTPTCDLAPNSNISKHNRVLPILQIQKSNFHITR